MKIQILALAILFIIYM
ncbi:hypothetical protein BDFB_014862 [Asbolus verrucosus]|uniref:Uncharacterized protein n=1 Tax=Asbolus verrucosus TaxID=1661398 RepID=A0A482VD12_ASBVE|nr:hypothetical protein BDFB_014862 [Asbolus verrucosus]